MQDHQLLEIFMNEDFGCQLKNNISDKSFQKITKVFTKCTKTIFPHNRCTGVTRKMQKKLKESMKFY